MMNNWIIIIFDKNDEKILSRKLKDDCEEEKAREIQSVAFGNIIARLRASTEETASAIYDNHLEVYNVLYPESSNSVFKNIVDSSPYGQKMKESKALLDELKIMSNSIGI